MSKSDVDGSVTADDNLQAEDAACSQSCNSATWTLGPLSIDTSVFTHCFKLRQVVKLSDKVKASFGGAYNLNQRSLAPIGSIIYQFDKNTVAELSERGAIFQRKWSLGNKKLSVHFKGECKIGYKDYAARSSLFSKPDYHLSVDGVSPAKYYLLAMGIVLLCKVPFSLNDKEKEMPVPGVPRMSGYTRLSLKRKGPAHFRIIPWEGGLILDT